MQKTVMALMVLAFSIGSEAADKWRNGGNVVICQWDDIVYFELLDLHEGRNQGLYHRFGAEKDVKKIISDVFYRLAAFDGARADNYREHFWSFYSNYVTDLDPVQDAGDIELDNSCKVEQVAVNYSSGPLEARYWIHEARFKSLNAVDQAALILHEIIYREAVRTRTDKFQTSEKIRNYTAYLFSKKILTDSAKDYKKVTDSVF